MRWLLFLAAAVRPGWALTGFTAQSNPTTSPYGYVYQNITMSTGSTPNLQISINGSSGGVLTMLYNNVQIQSQVLQGNPSGGARDSQINSGQTYTDSSGQLGVQCSQPNLITSVTPNCYVVSCQTYQISGTRSAASGNGTITNYYIVQSGTPAIFQATHDDGTFTNNQLRYTWRFIPNLMEVAVRPPQAGQIGFNADIYDHAVNIQNGVRLGGGNIPTTVSAGVNAAATLDTAVYVHQNNGTTASQYYSGARYIENFLYGVRGNQGFSAYMVLGAQAYEKSSGGPFFRDLNILIGRVSGSDQNAAVASPSAQAGAVDETDLFFYMKSTDVQTEQFRFGLSSPYCLYFVDDTVTYPTTPDFSFYSGLNLLDYVSPAERGTFSGSLTGTVRSGQHVVHIFNDQYQYFNIVNSDLTYTISNIVPGTYNFNAYRVELRIATAVVTVNAGTNTVVGVQGQPASNGYRTVYWVIGTFDGQPNELMNGGETGQLRMHPTDARQSPYSVVTYTIGNSVATNFPLAQISQLNSPTTIVFTLTAAQALNQATFRIATTVSFGLAVPVVVCNGIAMAIPAAPPSLRGGRPLTQGSYRGYGTAYDFFLPQGLLLTGTNTFTIDVKSPYTFNNAVDPWINPYFMYDALELFSEH